MKNISVVLLSILIGSISTGCKKEENKDFLSYEDVIDIYYENRELINGIKDGLFSSGFIPHDGMTESGYNSNIENSIFLSYDYKNGQLICSDDPQGEKLQSIQNVHSDAIEYFMRMNKNNNPSIDFRKILFFEDVIIEFEFRSNYYRSDPRAGILYTTEPDNVYGDVHIEDNWYVYKYNMP